jgi:hypothetical protein
MLLGQRAVDAEISGSLMGPGEAKELVRRMLTRTTTLMREAILRFANFPRIVLYSIVFLIERMKEKGGNQLIINLVN